MPDRLYIITVIDHVLPPLPVRQWVLSLPKRLRYHLQRDRQALNAALRIFLDEIERHLRMHHPSAGPNARAGAVAFIHCFGSSLNLHTHFHVCAIDGVFEPDPDHGIRFIAMDELDTDNAAAVQGRVGRRILRAFVRRGLLDKDDRKDTEQWNHGGEFSLRVTLPDGIGSAFRWRADRGAGPAPADLPTAKARSRRARRF